MRGTSVLPDALDAAVRSGSSAMPPKYFHRCAREEPPPEIFSRRTDLLGCRHLAHPYPLRRIRRHLTPRQYGTSACGQGRRRYFSRRHRLTCFYKRPAMAAVEEHTVKHGHKKHEVGVRARLLSGCLLRCRRRTELEPPLSKRPSTVATRTLGRRRPAVAAAEGGRFPASSARGRAPPRLPLPANAARPPPLRAGAECR